MFSVGASSGLPQACACACHNSCLSLSLQKLQNVSFSNSKVNPNAEETGFNDNFKQKIIKRRSSEFVDVQLEINQAVDSLANLPYGENLSELLSRKALSEIRRKNVNRQARGSIRSGTGGM